MLGAAQGIQLVSGGATQSLQGRTLHWARRCVYVWTPDPTMTTGEELVKAEPTLSTEGQHSFDHSCTSKIKGVFRPSYPSKESGPWALWKLPPSQPASGRRPCSLCGSLPGATTMPSALRPSPAAPQGSLYGPTPFSLSCGPTGS